MIELKESNFISLTKEIVQEQIISSPQIVFEVTDACNLKCKYCGYGELYESYDERLSKKLSIKKAGILLKYLIRLWNSRDNRSHRQQVYISFYGGEPLLNMKFIKHVIDFVNGENLQNVNFKYSMTTNAMLLDRYIEYLVENDFRLLISIDGDKHCHSYRVDLSGANSFDKVYENIMMIKNTYPKYYDENVNFNSVLHNRNSVSEIYGFIKEKLGKMPSIAELNSSGIRKENESIFWNTFKNKYESLHQSENYDDLNKEMFIDSPDTQSLAVFLQQYSGNTFKSYNELLYEPSSFNLYPTGTCLPFSKKIFVTVNGKILPCERIDHKYALGQIGETEVLIDYELIAKRYNNWHSKVSKQCNACYNKLACIQCVFKLDDLEGKPVCSGFMGKNDFNFYVESQMDYLIKNPSLYKEIMKKVFLR